MKLSNSLLNKHENCPIRVVHNYTPKKSKTNTINRPALVCACHNKWIKWLSVTEADEIESLLGETQ
jgi:hypothetical protein